MLSEIPPESLNHNPESVLVLDQKIFAECLRVCLDDPELLHSAAAEDFARGETPPCVSHMFTMATMTAFGENTHTAIQQGR